MNANKSLIFTAYNKARSAARREASANGMKLDPKRVNRALGVIQSKSDRPYHTTMTTCDCPDHRRNPDVFCKHITARMIERRALEAQLKSAQSVIITNSVIVDGAAVDIAPSDATMICNKIAASRRRGQGGMAYRMKAIQ